jgi:hypothetical protein|tara:strand:+ start:5394 stop:5567 length:174 start_codon:yes stop_codon:yes gene_type:complete
VSKRKKMMNPDEYRSATLVAQMLRAKHPEMPLKEASLKARDAIRAEREEPLMRLKRD